MDRATKRALLFIVVASVAMFFSYLNIPTADAEDWNNPVTTSTYSSVLTDLKARDVSSATMDFSSATNIPTNSKRISGNDLQNWNGSSWDTVELDHSHHTNTSNPHSVTAAQVGAASAATLSAHTANTSNPHSVTAAQAGALSTANNLSDVSNSASALANIGGASTATLTAHTSNTSNPHSVTASQAGALAISNNLSDIGNAVTARSNLGAAKSGSNGDITDLWATTSVGASANVDMNCTVLGCYVALKPADVSDYEWRFQTGGKVLPPPALRYDYTPWPSSWTVRRSLNPAAATAENCAEAWNTLVQDLIAQGILQ